MKSTATQRRAPGVIRADEAYTVAEFRRRTGLGDFAFRAARAAGLRVIAFNKKRYVRGQDWLAFLAEQADAGERELSEAGI